ncbi:thymidine phosphorylase [Streptosporangium sp. NPDC051022]|uniref:thymidine phosphorylase n=1 Tax=Streptosporangium sp. NPDC051022 TaxID=3155752 RepID=UPI00342024E2
MNAIGAAWAEGTSERVIRLLTDKRRGLPMRGADIEGLVRDFTAGGVPDYQMASWLATVACTGLSAEELTALTAAYADSGERLSLSGSGRPVADKHSTGGVGDKTTLVVAPVVAACGVGVGKVTGRGLGYMGGTVDKLESVPGLDLELSGSAFAAQVADLGLAVTGQSSSLVPGDRITYALRDVTGTVDSIPLIAASIMSKKIAVRCDSVVLDVKYGDGAVLPDRAVATELARTMLELGRSFGLPTAAVLSSMEQPLGYAVGNGLEVREAITALSGTHVEGLTELATTISALMISTADPGVGEDQARDRVREVLSDGSALRMFRAFVARQGGDAGVVDDPSRLETAPYRLVVTAAEAGYVARVAARRIGEVALRAGAGRLTYGAPIDHGAGVVLSRRVGDAVAEGEPLATLHGSNFDRLMSLVDVVRGCIDISRQLPNRPDVIGDVLRQKDVV